MKLTLAVLALLVAGSSAADPLFIDALVETPLASLQQQFPGLRKEGCYRVAADRYLLIEIDRKDQKPWRVVLASTAPCRRPQDVAVALDVRHRSGVDLGARTMEVVQKLKRPDALAPPESQSRRLGDTEYFYICRVSEGCARHTSVFMREGTVSAIAEWYSE